ncbi:sensor histidine kinase [Patulibacter minatonensis]|uniref:sensor histidine kinase n=1 Tax=Patulibacter minatonensis TaxID=298163 RepID=UPI0006842CBA|nr:ATP-binding protein [Patulibacter minatonensis]
MIVPSDPPADRRGPAPGPTADARHDLRARPVIGVLTGLCAIVALAGAVAATGVAVVVVGGVLALGLAGTTGAIWSRSLLAPAAAVPGAVPPSIAAPATAASPALAPTTGSSPTAVPAGAAIPTANAPSATTLLAPHPDPTLRAELDRMERLQQQDLAQRLHDGPLQHVITALQDVTDMREGEDVDLRELEVTLREAILGMRDASTDLYDDVVRDAGLAAALGQVAKTAERAGGPTVDVAVAADTSSAHDALVIAAARELLTNVRKHAHASHALVVVERTRDGLLRLVVDDDGIGFDDDARRDAAARGHLGLRSVEDRARRAGGRLVAGSSDRGAVVEVLLPADDGARPVVARRGVLGAARTGDGPGRLVGA